MDVNIIDVLKAVHGEALGTLSEAMPVREISTDTRTLGKDDLFFALQGERFDGHHFIKQAFQKGARHFVVSRDGFGRDLEAEANFIRVPDTLRAYGDLAKVYRQKFRVPVVAVTGSAGKTTVKELTAHIVSQKYRVLKNRGTENNLVGVPKTLFQMDKAHEVVILEIGTSRPGEIERLSSIIGPQMGIITQIGLAHLEGLESSAGVREEKMKLIPHVERGGLVILNGQDPALGDIQCGMHKLTKVSLSRALGDRVAEKIWCYESGSSFTLDGQFFETPLLGRHNILNCLFAIEASRALGVETAVIQKAVASFKAVPGRMTLRVIEGIHFIDDSYNSNPSSFQAALETLKEFKLRERRGVVCGDMLELGAQSETLHRELGERMASMLFDFVIAAGPMGRRLADSALKAGLGADKIFIARDSAEAGRLCREIAKEGDRILVKGSRGMQMEKVFECFITSSTR